MSASCIYEGTIRHRRFEPRREFSHRLALAYLDLDELPGLLDGGLVARRPRAVRSFGHCFNRVSFYYCFESGGERMQALVAEVTNTPWGERNAYVIESKHPDSAALAGEFDKALHVSPFMGMDHRYDARAATPARTLSVHIASSRAGVTVFDATLALRRRALTRASIAAITVRYPLATVRVLALIYAHALGLKLAGVPVHRRPRAART